MATSTVIILVLSCALAYGIPSPPVVRNTIFMDEKLEGQIFEDIDSFSNVVENFTSYRLPTTTRPIHYNLLWAVDINSRVFSGDVGINLHATQPNVSEIVIHAGYLNITSLQLLQNNVPIPQSYSFDTNVEFMKIALVNNDLQYDPSSPVVYELKISFVGRMRTDMEGIYESWFRNPNETEHGYQEDIYRETPIMSIYILSIIHLLK